MKTLFVMESGPVIIDRKIGEDNFGNELFKIMLPHYTFRGVKLPSKSRLTARMRIFLKRNFFVNVKMKYGRDDCCTNVLTVGNYTVEWGDGDNLGADGPNQNIVDSLKKVSNTYYEWEAICTVLSLILDNEEEWTKKE